MTRSRWWWLGYATRTHKSTLNISHNTRILQVWFDTRNELYKEFIARESVPLSLIAHLRNDSHFHGGINQLDRFHFGIVRGGSWVQPETEETSHG